ncbi:unnamed protein product [Spodoptera littoralis]|uniref:Uncharacterized protein n=1 Tax=Spodoptera littoralis TaxID=7109 RepID=A0A9P0N890_SPOLI|nr:unnamed protein product [Spodoptera littoralis]CAH1646028.1 unnamed protein product [Spodoptera littoralis]
MGHLLWSLGKLVNDPSTALLDELRQRVFKKREPIDSISIEEAAASGSESIEVKSIPLTDAANSTTNSFYTIKNNDAETATISVQTGSGYFTSRQVSIQVKGSVIGKHNKSTSVQATLQSDRCTGASVIITKRDAKTMPMKLKVCRGHRDIVAILRQWPLGDYRFYRHISIFQSFMLSIKDFLKSFSIEKIENLPACYAPESEMLKLYKSASIDYLVDNEKPHRRKSNTRYSVKPRILCENSVTLKCRDINYVQNKYNTGLN